MPQSCVICRHFNQADGGRTSLIGLTGNVDFLLDGAQTRLDDGAQDLPHVLAHVCPEHVVAVYRGRVPGVAMAWRVATQA